MTSHLEAQLTSITREFVARIVETIRNASFAEVAGYKAEVASSAPTSPRKQAKRAVAKSPTRDAWQTAEKRADLAKRVVKTLVHAGAARNARAIAKELGVEVRLLEAPLRELREAGKIAKHGDKRATTYSASST